MAEDIQAITLMTKSMGMGFLNELMEGNIRETGPMVSNMVKDFILVLMVKNVKGNGLMETELDGLKKSIRKMKIINNKLHENLY